MNLESITPLFHSAPIAKRKPGRPLGSKASVVQEVRALGVPVDERVRALNHLETILSVIPKATDRLESWFARPVVKCLRNMGIVTLADLVSFN